METAVESCVVNCGGCLRLIRDRGVTPSVSIGNGDGGYLTSSDTDTSFQQCLAPRSKVTIQSVNKALAAALSTKLQTLPRIQEHLSPQNFPAASALLGCSLEETAMSFNSISSHPSSRFDASWSSFLKNFNPGVFEQQRRLSRSSAGSSKECEIVSEIMPEAGFQNDITHQTVSDVMEDVTYQEMERDVNDTVMGMIGRKHAGQKKEKPKGGRMSSFSRKTVPVVVSGEDQDSPFGSNEAPFNFTILPSTVDISMDEVSTRERGWPLLPDERKKLEARYVEVIETSSCGSSFKSKRKWLSPGGSSSIRRKKGSVKSLDTIGHAARLDPIPKVAGVCDGSRNRRSRGELWIRT